MENPKIETEKPPQETQGKTTNTIINNIQNTINTQSIDRRKAGSVNKQRTVKQLRLKEKLNW
jgi:hypothetical protein